MAFVSPGVFTREQDLSDYVPSLSSTIFGVIGGATKGEVNKVTRISNEPKLIETFGLPIADGTDYAIISALQYLREGRELLFLRVADANVAKATGIVQGVDADTAALLVIQSAFTVTAQAAGAGGNAITITLLDPAGADVPLSVNTVGTDITVTLATDSASEITSNAFDVVAIMLADSTTFALVDAAIVTGQGTTVIAAASSASLTGGITVGSAATLTFQAAITFDADVTGTEGNAITVTLFDDPDNDIPLSVNTVGNDIIVTLETDGTSTPISTVDEVVAIMLGDGPTAALIDPSAESGQGAVVLTAEAQANLAGGADAPTVNSVTFKGASYGTWADGIDVIWENGSGAGKFKITISAFTDNARVVKSIVEIFNDVTIADPAAADFIETIINVGILGESQASRFVTALVTDNTSVPTPVTITLVGGNDGIDSLADADFIGTVTGQLRTGLQAFADPETLDVNVIAIPGNSDPDVVQALLNLAEARGDTFAIIDPPFGLDDAGIEAWHNGTTPFSHPAFVSKVGALYWTWTQVFDTYSRKDVFIPPSGPAAGQYAFTDRIETPFRSPAGLNRGKLKNVKALEFSPDRAIRDRLNGPGNGNAVNSIVEFIREGIVIFGERTLQRKASATDSIPVSRMLLYVKKVIATSLLFLDFEPNDAITQRRFISLVTPALEYVQANRGLFDFRVICDETTNPPDQVQRKELRGQILLKPTITATKIIADFTLFSTGADFSEFVTSS